MQSKDLHLSDMHLADQEILLAADGELSNRRAAQVHGHLAECWTCRARMAEIERTVADFARAHRQTLDPQLPPINGARVHLRAQLAVLASDPPARPWRRLFQSTAPMRAAACMGIAFVVAAVAGKLLLKHPQFSATNSGVISTERGARPDPRLTPGATRRVALGDVCSVPHEEVVAEVSASLREEVFREYGISSARPDDYEVDYLIAPRLGGVEEIHNLWPEPHASRTWNAYVKDALEERLHEMVCDGELDLSTAQRDIAADWITAYKKYFHTDRPVALHSRLESGERPWVCWSKPRTTSNALIEDQRKRTRGTRATFEPQG